MARELGVGDVLDARVERGLPAPLGGERLLDRRQHLAVGELEPGEVVAADEEKLDGQRSGIPARRKKFSRTRRPAGWAASQASG